MGTDRRGALQFWLGAAVAACLVTVAFGLTAPHDAAWPQLSRHRRSSSNSSSSPPEPPKDANGRPLPPPHGYAHGRGRRAVHSVMLIHSLSSHTTAGASEEHMRASAAREKRSSDAVERVPPADAVQINSVRSRRSSNHSAPPPPRGPPPNRGRREAGDLHSEAEERDHLQQGEAVALTRERRAANHSAPPRGPPAGSRSHLNHHSVNGEEAGIQRHRRDTSADSSSSSSSSSDDDDDDDDSSPSKSSPPARGRPPGGAPQGRGPPPKGCGGRRPSTGSGTNSTDTETVERFSRRRGRNRG